MNGQCNIIQSLVTCTRDLSDICISESRVYMLQLLLQYHYVVPRIADALIARRRNNESFVPSLYLDYGMYRSCFIV